jgi:hypothetical protein
MHGMVQQLSPHVNSAKRSSASNAKSWSAYGYS